MEGGWRYIGPRGKMHYFASNKLYEGSGCGRWIIHHAYVGGKLSPDDEAREDGCLACWRERRRVERLEAKNL